MTTQSYNPNMVLSTQEYAVIGARPVRHDGEDKVTGRARYSADIHLPGMLTGKLLRSPHAHARIRGINTSRAAALPGVHAVVTAADMPDVSAEFTDQAEGATVNYGFYSRNVIAREKALYKGHAVAAVAATDAATAERALDLIDVDYEILTPVLSAEDALADDAPILHERLLTMHSPTLRSGGWGDADRQTNLANRFEFRLGDVEDGFARADVIVEREFRTRAVHQGYIEPHAATAHWTSGGFITVWCSSQGHFSVRDHTSRILGVPVSRVKVVPMEIGGGFGGKGQGGVYLEPLAAKLSEKSGRPVKIVMSREEVFVGTGPTSGSRISVKMGATADGRIVAAEARLAYEAGAFPGSPVASGCRTMFAPYDIPNALVEGADILVNKQKAAAYRAPGSPAAAFAAEQVIDELALKLDMDALEIRLLNTSQEGSRQIAGPRFRRIGNREILEAAREHPHLRAPLEKDGRLRGRGIAGGAWFNGSGPASAIASVNPDGTVSLTEGSPDIGGSRAAMAMHVAEVLGIAVEDVKPAIADTDSIGYSSGAGGSGVTFKMGRACYEAAQDARRQLIERAARIWDVSPEDVEYDSAALRHKSDDALSVSFQDLAAQLNGTGGPIVGRATVNPAGVGNAFGLHVVDVEVDAETGKVDILRYTALQDAGKAIHPAYVEGQIQGGAAQGAGWALNEEYHFAQDGTMNNSTFLDYRMPTSLDLPMIDTVIVEVANPGHPYGVRGVGEVSIVPPMAAIANAIQDAAGVRLTELPMSPGVVAKAIAEAGGG